MPYTHITGQPAHMPGAKHVLYQAVVFAEI